MTKHVNISAGKTLTTGLAARTRGGRHNREAAVAAAQVGRGRNDPLPDLKFEQRAITELAPAKRPVRKKDTARIAELARIIGQLGFTVPLLITTEGRIIDGHARLEAARLLDLATVPCIIVDHLSDGEVDLLKISVNRLAEKGEWDLDALRDDLMLLQTLDLDIGLTSFTAPELDIVISLDDGEIVDALDAVEPVLAAGPPVTRAGDLWLLGKHRLLCGDATDPDSYARLMDGAVAACVFTDPPYNIPIAGFVSPTGKHQDFAMGVGEMSDEGFQAFLATVLAQAKLVSAAGATVFACMDWRNVHLLVLAGKQVGLSHINTAVWTKGSGGMGGLYRSAHEMVAVFAHGDRPATNNVGLGRHGRDRCNVWAYPGANRRGTSAAKLLADHPTPKPVELVRDALLDVTRRGDIVLDPFLGSGTTIIAANACGRIGYGMELDPAYADLIVRRWQAVTGGEAVLVETGEAFSAVVARRAVEGDC